MWTKEEEEYLMNNYENIPINEIVAYLKKSKSSVLNRCRKLGIVKKCKHYSTGAISFPWTEEEHSIIKNNYPSGGAEKCLKLLPNRSIFSIYGRIMFLVIKKDITTIINTAISTGKCRCKRCEMEFPYTSNYFSYTKKYKGKNNLSTICRKCTNIHWRKKRENYKYYLSSLRSLIVKRHTKFDYINPCCSLNELVEIYDNQNGFCKLTNIKMTTDTSNGRCLTNISVDRKNSLLGYTKDNIQIVCLWANLAKTNLEQKEFINFCKLVVNNEK